MTFCVMSRDCDRVKNITEQMGVKATVLHAKGLPVLAKRYAKRAGLIIGAVLGAAAVFISSRMIWEIRVEGNENVTDEEVIRIMKGLGISEGSIKNTENLEYIYNSFLLKEKKFVSFAEVAVSAESGQAAARRARGDRGQSTASAALPVFPVVWRRRGGDRLQKLAVHRGRRRGRVCRIDGEARP